MDVRLSNGTGSCRPRACARASFTPGLARSALVCALKCAMPARMRSCETAPWHHAGDVTPDSHRGGASAIRSTRRSSWPRPRSPGRIDGEQNRTDLGIRIPEGQTHRIPWLGQIRRKPPSSSVTTSASRTWARPDSNRRPSRCKRGALPAALRAQYRVPRGSDGDASPSGPGDDAPPCSYREPDRGLAHSKNAAHARSGDRSRRRSPLVGNQKTILPEPTCN